MSEATKNVLFYGAIGMAALCALAICYIGIVA
ncbi:hypothetical protein FHW16_000015 [Phyllobacterium myrsinacearum]|uniref:Uncharacterized protein n=1 Tax=Phyllobacterium myrsinacearum TaxID=28101 RepID=A0A839E952_9HYPH|nr:hypothetical protein [Phyllobacterium myrsinacearum]